jgi:head-tail adaptor
MQSSTGGYRFSPNQQKIRRSVLGDMRHLIQIRMRAIQPINLPGQVDFSEAFVTTNTVYAYRKTVGNDKSFDGTNTTTAVTDIWIIRYIPTLTDEKWIFFDNNIFDISSFEDLDGRKMFMKVLSNIRGTEDKVVNYA